MLRIVKKIDKEIHYYTLLYTIIHYYTLLYTIIHYYTLLYTIIHLQVQDRPAIGICRGFVLAAVSIPHHETDNGVASNGRLMLARAKVLV